MTLDKIECDEFLPYPPAAVWRALTDPDLVARQAFDPMGQGWPTVLGRITPAPATVS